MASEKWEEGLKREFSFLKYLPQLPPQLPTACFSPLCSHGAEWTALCGTLMLRGQFFGRSAISAIVLQTVGLSQSVLGFATIIFGFCL